MHHCKSFFNKIIINVVKLIVEPTMLLYADVAYCLNSGITGSIMHGQKNSCSQPRMYQHLVNCKYSVPLVSVNAMDLMYDKQLLW